MLYQNDTDLLFPPRVIASLAGLRGPEWQRFVSDLSNTPENDPKVLGFMLVMVRLNGCMTCYADSYRAMRGCTLCAQQAVARFKGTDQELLQQWTRACQDIECWQREGTTPSTDLAAITGG
ncbi:hypothetical protein ACFLYO_04605 [Chloroflexota bacterium]